MEFFIELKEFHSSFMKELISLIKQLLTDF
jgi:hypothetical protein